MERCFACQKADRDCLLAKGAKRCATCGQYCSYLPTADEAQQRERLSGVWKVLDTMLRSEQTDEKAIRESMADLVRIAERYGGMQVGNTRLHEGL